MNQTVVIKFGYLLEYLRILGYAWYNKPMRENASDAGNQQERPNVEAISVEIGNYITGFTDGEGSFNVSTINRNQDFRTGWKIALSFNISQRDHTMLYLLQKTLGCGTIRERKDGVGYFEVRRIDDLIKIIIPFFERFPLKSVSKRNQFEVFKKIVSLMSQKKHFTPHGLEKILALRATIAVGRKRKYTSEEILSTFRISESSETTRRTPQKVEMI